VNFKLNRMSDEILRYTDLAAAIQLARSTGMTTREIARELTRGMTHADALKHAKQAAPLLDMTVAEFMRLRKNE
jgi:predicted transcriptional regulator